MESEGTPQFKTHISEESFYFAEEIIEEILSRLPVKSLLKFRCVSKPWRALIGSNRFVKKHLHTSTNNHNFAHHNIILNSILPQCELKQCSLTSLLNDPSTDQFRVSHLENVYLERVCIVGCCNGVVCLLLDGKRFMLWNPSTRKTKKLPDMDHNHEMWCFGNYGFGYDDLSGDYMVFGISLSLKEHRVGIYAVYSLLTNSWKIVKKEKISSYYRKGKFASGKIHWGIDRDITYFDLRSELFDVIEAPLRKGFCSRSMGVFGGRFGLLYNDGVGNFDFWVIKEYGVNSSWEKVVNVPHLHTTPVTSYLCLLGKGPNGEILLPTQSSFEIFYSEDDGFWHCQVRDDASIHEAYFNVESLVAV